MESNSVCNHTSDWQNWTTGKRESDLLWVWLQTELDTKSCYQLIKTMTKFEKETRHRFYVFIKKTTVNSTKCETTVRAYDVCCPLAQAWRVNCLFNCPITLSNYMHDAYNVQLVLKSSWWHTITFENFVIVLITLKTKQWKDKLKLFIVQLCISISYYQKLLPGTKF